MPSKSKRILLLTTSYLPLIGGSELAIKEVTDRITDYEFDLITARVSAGLLEEEKMGRVHVFRVGNRFNLFNFLLPKSFLSLPIFFKARSLIKNGRSYDAVHVFQASQAAGAAWLLKWFYPRLPVILTLQEGKDLSRQSWLLRFFRYLIIRHADQATVISNYLGRYLASVRKNLPIKLIPNGVDWENFSREFSYGETSQLCDQLGILPGDKVIISSSRLTYKNGIDNLIRAFRVLCQQSLVSPNGGPTTPYRLLLIGDGELRGYLTELAKQLGVRDRIIFTGTVNNSELVKYLKISQVFVRPSRSEGLGISFLEAMAAGIPIVGPAVGGIPDFLKDDETGLICKPLDPDDIARKIALVLEGEVMRKKIIKNARELVKKDYNWEQIAPEYQKLYAQF
ncbi:MAG: glycosyltransferase family 4 protein [bacterium]|nr:glycosyltransferase family 4 protein [bacterium]